MTRETFVRRGARGRATWLLGLGLVLGLAGCATVGHDFPVESVAQLEIGTTTQAEVRRLFGDPWRMGIEDGTPTWTYGLYSWGLFAGARTRDLVVRFDGRGVVRSYTFSSSDPADAQRAGP